MPADGFVATAELRFVTRYIPDPRYGASGIAKGVRILQQRWVARDNSSEWRDVPLVEEG